MESMYRNARANLRRTERREDRVLNEKDQLGKAASKLNLSGTCHEQEQSPFFKLPSELRVHIYRMLLANWPRLHIYRKRNGKLLTPFRCYKEEILYDQTKDGVKTGRCLQHPCWKQHSIYNPASEQKGVKKVHGPATGLLSLPLACRRLYLEAGHELYAANLLNCSGPYRVLWLTKTVPDYFLHSITRLSIDFDLAVTRRGGVSMTNVSRVDQVWEEACTALASMQGLTQLHITVWAFKVNSLQTRLQLLKPLCDIKVSDFTVAVPWLEDETVEIVGIVREIPFKVMYETEDHVQGKYLEYRREDAQAVARQFHNYRVRGWISGFKDGSIGLGGSSIDENAA